VSHDIVVIEGDGIGREVVPAAVDVLEALPVDFEFVEAEPGRRDAVKERTGEALPAETYERAAEADATLFGAAGETAADVILPLREAVDSFVNIRRRRRIPASTRSSRRLTWSSARNTEGVYSGHENRLSDDLSTLTRVVTSSASRELAEFACEFVDDGRGPAGDPDEGSPSRTRRT